MKIKIMKKEKLNVVIETPKGSTEKYDFDKSKGGFMQKKILPAGMVFPFDFGFIPDTIGEDGDPLDIIVISEFKSFPGCLMECRLLGGIMAEQGKPGKKKVRNDRFIAVPVCSRNYQGIRSLEDLGTSILHELSDFFINYNKAEGKEF
jgi:inorganic pyrophosphatase